MMTGSGLSAALFEALDGVYDIVDPAELQKFCDACGDAIVTYIQAEAVVTPGTFTTPSGAVTGTGDVT